MGIHNIPETLQDLVDWCEVCDHFSSPTVGSDSHLSRSTNEYTCYLRRLTKQLPGTPPTYSFTTSLLSPNPLEAKP